MKAFQLFKAVHGLGRWVSGSPGSVGVSVDEKNLLNLGQHGGYTTASYFSNLWFTHSFS